MTATALNMQTTPMAPYMGLMRRMTREQKLTVMAFLVSIMQEDEETEAKEKKNTDEEIENGLRQAFQEFKEYKEGKRTFKTADEFLKELEEV